MYRKGGIFIDSEPGDIARLIHFLQDAFTSPLPGSNKHTSQAKYNVHGVAKLTANSINRVLGYGGNKRAHAGLGRFSHPPIFPE